MTQQNISLPLAMDMTQAGSICGAPPPSKQPSRIVSIFNGLVDKLGLATLIMFLSFASYFLISHYIVGSVKVVGVSMVPTLGDTHRYLLDFLTYYQRDPHRGDIVMVRDPEEHCLVVKRIIAEPGQSVSFHNGKVLVDGKQLNEPYLDNKVRTFISSAHKDKVVTCGYNQYFVLGDNRTLSIDSRVYGAVKRVEILGLVRPGCTLAM